MVNGMFSIDSIVTTRRGSFYSSFRGLKPTAKVIRPRRGHGIDDLTADLAAFEVAQTAKATAQASTVGATAGIDDQTDAGMKAEKYLDAIMNNVYSDNPVKLAAWRTARHVKRAPKPAPPTTP